MLQVLSCSQQQHKRWHAQVSGAGAHGASSSVQEQSQQLQGSPGWIPAAPPAWRRAAIPLWELAMHPSSRECRSSAPSECAQCRCRKPGWGVASGGLCPFPGAPHPWWWCCEMVPRKRRTEPKAQLSWCPVALASTVAACHGTPSIHSTENSRSFPFLHKMIYSSLSYGKETMREGDQVCQEQRIPFISVFSLTCKKCIIITERS